MKRRAFIAGLSAALVPPLAARGQTRKPNPKIGLMFTGTRETTRRIGYAEDFRAGLRAQGLIDGETVNVEIRYGEFHPERLPALAAELADLPVDVLVGAAESFDAMRGTTATLPVVSAGTCDPIATGVAERLAHPGGRFTGIGEFASEYTSKRFELLKRTVPGLSRLGLMLMRKDLATISSPAEAAARALELELRIYAIDETSDYEPAMAEIATWGGGLAVGDGGKFSSEATPICALALKHRLPSVSGSPFPPAGMMLGYGSDVHWQFRRAAYFVARILEGAKPGEIPFERPPRFLTKINLKTAATLGIEIPPDVLAAADEVIE